jgi:hypothetical protein
MYTTTNNAPVARAIDWYARRFIPNSASDLAAIRRSLITNGLSNDGIVRTHGEIIIQDHSLTEDPGYAVACTWLGVFGMYLAASSLLLVSGYATGSIDDEGDKEWFWVAFVAIFAIGMTAVSGRLFVETMLVRWAEATADLRVRALEEVNIGDFGNAQRANMALLNQLLKQNYEWSASTRPVMSFATREAEARWLRQPNAPNSYGQGPFHSTERVSLPPPRDSLADASAYLTGALRANVEALGATSYSEPHVWFTDWLQSARPATERQDIPCIIDLAQLYENFLIAMGTNALISATPELRELVGEWIAFVANHLTSTQTGEPERVDMTYVDEVRRLHRLHNMSIRVRSIGSATI